MVSTRYLCTLGTEGNLRNSRFRLRSVCCAGDGVFVLNFSRFIHTALADNEGGDLRMLRAQLG